MRSVAHLHTVPRRAFHVRRVAPITRDWEALTLFVFFSFIYLFIFCIDRHSQKKRTKSNVSASHAGSSFANQKLEGLICINEATVFCFFIFYGRVLLAVPRVDFRLRCGRYVSIFFSFLRSSVFQGGCWFDNKVNPSINQQRRAASFPGGGRLWFAGRWNATSRDRAHDDVTRAAELISLNSVSIARLSMKPHKTR